MRSVCSRKDDQGDFGDGSKQVMMMFDIWFILSDYAAADALIRQRYWKIIFFYWVILKRIIVEGALAQMAVWFFKIVLNTLLWSWYPELQLYVFPTTVLLRLAIFWLVTRGFPEKFAGLHYFFYFFFKDTSAIDKAHYIAPPAVVQVLLGSKVTPFALPISLCMFLTQLMNSKIPDLLVKYKSV